MMAKAAYLCGGALLLAALLTWQVGICVVVAVWVLPVGLIWYMAGEAPPPTRVFAAMFFLCAATLRPLAQIWSADHEWDAAQALIFDPGALAIAWGAVTLSWLIAEALSMLQIFLRNRRRMREYRLLGERLDGLCAEWGIPRPPETEPPMAAPSRGLAALGRRPIDAS